FREYRRKGRMKEKYLRKVFEANNLAMKCQKINLWGASATTGLYVTAYDDFSEVLEDLRNVIYHAEQIDSWEKCINKFKRDPDFDMAGVLESIEYHEGEMEEAFEKLKDFVEKRNQEGWDVIH
ncbi:MAG: hypothetical protein ACLUKO_13925, partial [Enterocloster bolteae]